MKKDLIEKYADETPEEMEQEQEDLETEVALTSKDLDQKITKFNQKVDPLMIDGEIYGYVQRPSGKQYNRIIPTDLAKFRKHPENIPWETARKYEDDMYELMAELIVNPKHTPEYWRENTGDEFMAAFQAHVFNVRQKLQENIDSFLRPT